MGYRLLFNVTETGAVQFAAPTGALVTTGARELVRELVEKHGAPPGGARVIVQMSYEPVAGGFYRKTADPHVLAVAPLQHGDPPTSLRIWAARAGIPIVK